MCLKIGDYSTFRVHCYGYIINITTDVLLKICEAMECHIEDILETVDD